jgi:O-antigen/teichoic acid export membrane protein
MLLLARSLGADALGAYSYSLSWATLLAIPALLGTDQLLVREIAASQARKEWSLLRGLLRRANGAVLLTSLVLALGAAAAAAVLSRNSQPEMTHTFWMALPFIPLIALTRVRQSAMQGLHRVVLGAIPEQLLQPGLFLAFLLTVDLLGARLSPEAAMAANIGATAAAFLVGARLLTRAVPPEAARAAPVYRDRDWLVSALPLMFLTGASALFGQADTLILGAVRGSSAVGAYTIAHKASEMAAVFLNAQIASLASSAASLYTLGDRKRLQSVITRMTRATLLVSAPIGIGLIVFGKLFLSMYGHSFVAASPALTILSVGQLANVAMGCVGLLLVVTGNERDVAASLGAGAAANVALSFLLAPRWGAEGVAVAYAVGMIIWNGWAVAALYRKTGIDSTAFGLFARTRVVAETAVDPA